jgi:hypothetical protein
MPEVQIDVDEHGLARSLSHHVRRPYLLEKILWLGHEHSNNNGKNFSCVSTSVPQVHARLQRVNLGLFPMKPNLYRVVSHPAVQHVGNRLGNLRSHLFRGVRALLCRF